MVSKGSKGFFTFKEPFNNKESKYEVSSITPLKEFKDIGIDAKNLVYIQNGLDESKYDEDLNNNVSIIALLNDSGEYFYIPENYIVSSPINDGVEYSSKVLLANLGELPDNLDLEYSKNEIKQIILDTLGIDTAIEIVINSEVTQKSYEEHESREAVRQVRPSLYKSYRTKYLESRKELDDLKIYVKSLEEYSIKKYNEDI